MDSHFQVIILGTGLIESITAAGLAKAGLKVAHVDANSYYGGGEASLTTKELQEFITKASGNSDTNFSSTSVHGELPTSSRDYSLSLSPSIIPSRGPLIAALIGSGVARYGGFKLLESISVYTPDGFKDVPGSKEDIFKAKELSLIDKRRLMRFLMFANGDFESSTELQGKQNMPFLSFLEEAFSLNEQLAAALAYALAFCKSVSDPTLPALERIRRYLRSAGRYGPSPFLVGQYGGLGELAQGFCRVCAVSGSTYILGREISAVETAKASSSETGDSKNFRLKLTDIPEELTADLVVSSTEHLLYFTSPSNTGEASERLAHGIVLIDGAISRPSPSQSASVEEETNGGDEEKPKEPEAEDDDNKRPVDAALLVFPPGELTSGKASGPVNVLVNGEGTLSCPRGKSLLYLSTTMAPTNEETPNPEQLLRPYLDATLSLLHTPDGSPLKEVASAFFIKSTPSVSESQISSLKEKGIFVSPSLHEHIAEAGDAAATTAESLFRDVLKRLGRQDAEEAEFWPPLPPGLDEDDDVV